MVSGLDSIFVPYIPTEGPSKRDLSLAESWFPFVNAFNTWMEQAQKAFKLTDNLFCVRMGMLVTVTGRVEQTEKVDIVAPVASFSTGTVLFSDEGYLQNSGGVKNISVTYIAKE